MNGVFAAVRIYMGIGQPIIFPVTAYNAVHGTVHADNHKLV